MHMHMHMYMCMYMSMCMYMYVQQVRAAPDAFDAEYAGWALASSSEAHSSAVMRERDDASPTSSSRPRDLRRGSCHSSSSAATRP